MSRSATSGDTVKVHYTGRLKDGTVFDSSRQREPIQFELGAGRVIPGFDREVQGMEPGESKQCDIPSGEAYGQRRDDLVLSLDRNTLPEGVDPQVGQSVQLQQPGGEPVAARVVDVNPAQVTVDANHPLAGQDLQFELELLEIA